MPNVVQFRRQHPPRAVGWASSEVNQWLKERLVAQGADPDMVVCDGGQFRFLRLRDIESIVGVKRSTIYRWIDEHRFPRPYILGAGAGRQPSKPEAA